MPLASRTYPFLQPQPGTQAALHNTGLSGWSQVAAHGQAPQSLYTSFLGHTWAELKKLNVEKK